MITPDPNLPRRVHELERLVRELQAEVKGLRSQRQLHHRDLRLAKTIEYLGNYPDTGNTFRIEFLDSYFTAAQGDETATHDGRGSKAEVFAQVVGGSRFVAEGAIVGAFWQRGLGGANKGEWWILDGIGGGMKLGRANGAITARSGTTPGIGTVHIYQHDGGNPGTLVDTGIDQANVINPWNAAFANNDWMQITEDFYGSWMISAADC